MTPQESPADSPDIPPSSKSSNSTFLRTGQRGENEKIVSQNSVSKSGRVTCQVTYIPPGLKMTNLNYLENQENVKIMSQNIASKSGRVTLQSALAFLHVKLKVLGEPGWGVLRHNIFLVLLCPPISIHIRPSYWHHHPFCGGYSRAPGDSHLAGDPTRF